jgi:hypothetical protein
MGVEVVTPNRNIEINSLVLNNIMILPEHTPLGEEMGRLTAIDKFSKAIIKTVLLLACLVKEYSQTPAHLLLLKVGV